MSFNSWRTSYLPRFVAAILATGGRYCIAHQATSTSYRRPHKLALPCRRSAGRHPDDDQRTWTNQRIQFAGNGTSSLRSRCGPERRGKSCSTAIRRLIFPATGWLRRTEVPGWRADGRRQHRGVSRHLGEATNSRLTNSAIVDYNPADVNTRYFWVSLYGDHHNRVDTTTLRIRLTPG